MKSLLVDMLLTDGFGDIKCFPCFVRSVPLSHHVTIGSLPYCTQKRCKIVYLNIILEHTFTWIVPRFSNSNPPACNSS